MIWSMAQSDAYKHGALSVILQSGQQRLLGVTLCHSDPTQTHRTLPDLLSLDINRCLLFWGGLWAAALERHWSLYSVYSLSCTTSSPSCHQCLHFSLCCTHCTNPEADVTGSTESYHALSPHTAVTHSRLVGEWRFCLTYKKVLIGYILCRMCMIFPVILICIVTIKSGSTSVKALILFYDL